MEPKSLAPAYDVNAEEALVLPSNKMLYIQQFTEAPAIFPEIVQHVNSLEDLFAYYQPNCNIEIENLDGEKEYEVIAFKTLADFDPLEIRNRCTAIRKMESILAEMNKVGKEMEASKQMEEVFRTTKDRERFAEVTNSISSLLRNIHVENRVSEAIAVEGLTGQDKPTIALIKDIFKDVLPTDLLQQEGDKWHIAFDRADTRSGSAGLHLKKILSACTSAVSYTDFLRSYNASVVSTGSHVLKCLRNILSDTSPLETAYRSVNIFFQNLRSKPGKNIFFMNAPMDALSDLDEPRFIEYVRETISEEFDKLDLCDNYSFLVIPGYVKSGIALSVWARIAYKNKLMLITDFMDVDNAGDFKDIFNDVQVFTNDLYFSNVVLSGNYLLARRQCDEQGEAEGIYVPGSCALAAWMYNAALDNVSTSSNFGCLRHVAGVRFDVRISDLVELEKCGLAIMMNKGGEVFPFSIRTLYTGSNAALRLYFAVRLLDYISKVMIDTIYKNTFEEWTPMYERNLVKKILTFLRSFQGEGKPISSFAIPSITNNEDNNGGISLHIQMNFIFEKSYMFILEYMRHNGYDWTTKYELL